MSTSSRKAYASPSGRPLAGRGPDFRCRVEFRCRRRPPTSQRRLRRSLAWASASVSAWSGLRAANCPLSHSRPSFQKPRKYQNRARLPASRNPASSAPLPLAHLSAARKLSCSRLSRASEVNRAVVRSLGSGLFRQAEKERQVASAHGFGFASFKQFLVRNIDGWSPTK